jgi:large subunit ribosomal protein L23
VETFFKVKVDRVRTLNYLGKNRRVGRSVGKRPRWKKAYVTLAPGQRIDFFGSA